MNNQIIRIEIYDKREEITTALEVEELSGSKFRMIDNDVLNCRLTLGTEFETRLNKEGKHEIIRITKESDFITRRFMLNGQFNASEYGLLGDEIIKQGGFWQVDFGTIATINLPKNSTLDIDEIFRIFEFNPNEIKDE